MDVPLLLLMLFGGLAVGMSLLAFAAMGVDKRHARRGERRISERLLFLMAGLMGGVGGTLGMLLFRHKTRHWYFRIGFSALAALQVGFLAFLGYGCFGGGLGWALILAGLFGL